MFDLRWVPLPVLQKALTEKVHREIALFLYLKMRSSSRVKIEGRKKREVMQVLKISESTLYRYVGTLRNWDWMGFDEKTSVYFIRGFKRIYEMEGFISKTAVRFSIKDLINLQTFSFSASVGYLLRYQNMRKGKGRGAGRQTWRSHQSPASVFKPVALSVMESIFSLSKDTLIKLKKKAIKLGYLKRKKGYEHLHHISEHSYEYYRIYPEHWGRLRRDGPMVSLIMPDMFIDYLLYRRKNYD